MLLHVNPLIKEIAFDPLPPRQHRRFKRKRHQALGQRNEWRNVLGQRPHTCFKYYFHNCNAQSTIKFSLLKLKKDFISEGYLVTFHKILKTQVSYNSTYFGDGSKPVVFLDELLTIWKWGFSSIFFIIYFLEFTLSITHM